MAEDQIDVEDFLLLVVDARFNFGEVWFGIERMVLRSLLGALTQY